MKTILKTCIAVILISLNACDKDPVPTPQLPPPPSGMFKIELDHTFGNRDLKLDSVYVNASGESIQFTAVNYYISNVKLTKSDGTTWAEPESYHLIKLSSPESALLSISNVPAGDYTAYGFTIGVDSARNVSGAQTGALDPVNQMFWSWNSGYKFIVAEGASPQSSSGTFAYHIGGFRNENGSNALQTFSHSFNGQSMSIKPNAAPQIHTHIDLAMFFDGAAFSLSVASIPVVHMPGVTAVKLSENFKEAIDFEHFHQ